MSAPQGWSRRALLRGAAALALLPRAARAGRPVVLALTSGASARSSAILEAFKAGTEGTTRVSYELGPEVDAAAFLADGIRDLEVSAVFALGDRAFVAAVREFTTTPLIYADVIDPGPGAGRANVTGLSPRVDPGRGLAKLHDVLPRLNTLGVLRGGGELDPAWAALLTQQATALGVRIEQRTATTAADVGNASAALLALAQVIWPQPDPGLWTGSVVSRLLYDAQFSHVPVVGLDRSWLSAANPAPLVIETSARGIGEAAAAAILRVVGLTPAGGGLAFPDPWLVGSKRALRALGLSLRREAAERVDEWVD